METGGSRRFAAHHPWDRFAVPVMVALIWLGILMGFVPEVVAKAQKNDLSYPIAVHIHAVAFVGWLVFLTTQVTLVRRGNLALHRRLGVFGAVLAAVMVVLGLWVSYVVDHADFGTPKEDPAFASIQILDMVGFGALVAAGVLLRREAAGHKRLMLLATLCIVDAGYSRWWGAGLESLFGKTFFGIWMTYFLGNVLLIVAIGLYDAATRRRLHPAYMLGAPLALGLQVLASWLYVTPWWKPIATRLIGH